MNRALYSHVFKRNILSQMAMTYLFYFISHIAKMHKRLVLYATNC